MLFWSAVIWLFYELFNFRLQNWYYVNVPAERWVRWTFTFIAFATVLPAVFLSERLLDGAGLARRTAWRPLRMTAERLRGIQVVGLIFLVLVLAWPRYFFPLVWGATTLHRLRTAVYPNRDASTLANEGPYRFTRNPMYTGMAMAYVGGACIVGSLGALVLLPLAMVALYYLVIRREERHLREAFGDSYGEYQRRVRRWL